MLGGDLECQIEGLARGNDTKILIENDGRLSNRIHECASIQASWTSVNCFLNMETLSRGGGVYRTLSLGAPNRCQR